ncbi:hypothetical protein KKF60_01515 [Patescibacteria group bacterium]|nr:hypothetical protein [Patescibacteria group bacterium]MBU4458564.1 hypothetical protein [Patescibacteria group bacterium]MCG2696092.1 hypothetical protein [Candidatus Portnoybacteria bacterium]
MGISRLTAWEIAGNHDDIVVDAGGPDKKTGKFVGWITRGPGHNFKPLLNTQPIYDTLEQAKQAMKDLVVKINEFVDNERVNSKKSSK